MLCSYGTRAIRATRKVHVNFKSRRTPLALIGVAALTLMGCAATSGDSGNQNGTHASGGDALQIVTTTTQLTDFATIIAGDDAEVTGLLPAGGSAHHFDPSPAELIALGNADVLIINGAGLESFIESAIEASGFDGAVIDASDGVDLELARLITGESLDGESHDHGHDDADHGHDEGEHGDHGGHDGHDGHDHGDHGDHDGHDHGGLNPHLWTSVRIASDMVHEISHRLGDIDPANAEAFDERAHAYMTQLATLDTWLTQQFERVPAADRVLVTGHDSLRYFLHDYDIAFAGSILRSFEDNAEPSAAEIEALVDAIRERGVRAIFVESSMNPRLAETIAKEANITFISESALFADSLGPADSAAGTYIGATIVNATTIVEAWGYDVDPLPETLQ